MANLRYPTLEITERSHWQCHHPEAGYTKRTKVIDGDIVHIWIEAEHGIVLEIMDVELLEMVLNEAGLLARQFHIIWDLSNVTDLSYNYKLAITNLLFNWRPAFGIIGFYNISSSMQVMAESFAAVVPEDLHIILTDTYEDVMEQVMAFKSGEFVLNEYNTVENPEEESIKKRFLEAIARISWLNMLEERIATPPPDSRYYPFFKAIDSMRQDLQTKEREKEHELKRLQHEYEHHLNQMTIKMNAQAEMNKKTSHDFEKEIAVLKTRIANQDMELTRVSMAIAEKTSALRNLLDQIHALEIDSALKRRMTDSCLNLIETETIEKRLNIELTESDSVFLSKLQKKHPNLNQREQRISLLVKLNYDTREIGRSVGMSTRGMESIRYRMHKKLGLDKHQSIKTYLSDLSVE